MWSTTFDVVLDMNLRPVTLLISRIESMIVYRSLLIIGFCVYGTLASFHGKNLQDGTYAMFGRMMISDGD